MAFLCSRLASRTFRGQFSVPCRYYAIPEKLPSPMELATGREAFEKKQHAAGNLDPYYTGPVPRLPNSTKENPNLVPSVFDCRPVLCSCHPDSSSVVWMWVFKGETRRCACGHWFKLVECKF